MKSTLSLIALLLLITGCSDSKPAKNGSKTAEDTAVAASAEASAAPAPQEHAASEPTTTVTPQMASTAETSPAVLFQKCAACHGNHAEKSALNRSAVIGEWDSKRIMDSIVGYQNGTYGGTMKTLMQNQVKGLSRVEIEALSEYIANLYVKTH